MRAKDIHIKSFEKSFQRSCWDTLFWSCFSRLAYRLWVYLRHSQLFCAPLSLATAEKEKAMTLRELKTQVETTKGKALPSVKELLESEIPVVIKEDTTLGSIAAYKNGFAVYSSGDYKTVFRIDECNGYTYRFNDGTESYCGEECFLDCDFVVLLMLIGEERIEYNRESRAKKCGFVQLFDEKTIENIADPAQDFAVAMENADLCRCAMSCLTDYQKKIIVLYFFEGMTLDEISKKLGVNTQTVCKRKNEALIKMRRFLQDL